MEKPKTFRQILQTIESEYSAGAYRAADDLVFEIQFRTGCSLVAAKAQAAAMRVRESVPRFWCQALGRHVTVPE